MPALRELSCGFLLVGALLSLIGAAPRGPDPVASATDALIDPPPVSLHVRNASIVGLAAALGSAAGVPFAPGQASVRTQAGAAPSFTLDADRRPFWSIFQDLASQHALYIQRDQPGLLTVRDYPYLLNKLYVWKGFASHLEWIERDSVVEFQASAPSDGLLMSIEILADPRIPAIATKHLDIVSMVDEKGHDLVDRVNVANDSLSGESGNQGGLIRFPFPAVHGKSIPLLKGRAHILVATQFATVEVADLEKSLHVPLRVGPRTLTLDDFQPEDRELRVFYSTGDPGRGSSRTDPDAPAIQLSFTDADGRTGGSFLWSRSSGRVIPGSFKPPFKATLRVPTRTDEVLVPFEFHDVPIPD